MIENVGLKLRLVLLIGFVCAGLFSSAHAGELSIEEMQEIIAEKGYTFSVADNPAMKYSLEELCGAVESEASKSSFGVSIVLPPGMELPSSFDWRDHAQITPIKNQGQCGSCWAFSAVGVMEQVLAIHDGIQTDLSEQWLVSCTATGDCDGGNSNRALRAMTYGDTVYADDCGNTGAVLETAFPYVGRRGVCGCPYHGGNHPYGLSETITIKRDIAAIKKAILYYGPVSILVNTSLFFHAYDDGVYNFHDVGTAHSVVLVGWDDSLGTEGAWILRNSWDTGWGMDGYMYISYESVDSEAYAGILPHTPDYNGNGVPDASEIAVGWADDVDGNGIPDDAPQAFWHVDANASAGGDGTSWGTAFATIQAAIDAATSGDGVIVADGTYMGTGNRDITFSGKALWVRSENGAENCIIDCQSTLIDPHRGFVFNTNETPDSILEGFTITNGSGDMQNLYGGGIFCTAASPSIKSCVLIANESTEGAGLFALNNASPCVTECTFKHNIATSGGAVFSSASAPTFENCEFLANDADSGAGVYASSSASVTLTQCAFIGNDAQNGACVYNNTSSPVITNCVFTENSAVTTSGGLYNVNASPIVTNCIFWSNTDSGGNIQIWDDANSSSVVTYSEVQGGYSGTGNINADPLFVYSLSDGGDGWGDDPSTSAIDESLNDVYEKLWLQATSPCIDAGDNSVVPVSLAEDLYGWDRILDDPDTTDSGSGTAPLVDMGVAEFARAIRVEADGSGYYTTIQEAIDAAYDGQSVLLGDGIYKEYNINFNGKAITVFSENGPENCVFKIISYSSHASFVFESNEQETSVLDGLTFSDCGISISYAGSTISNCVFRDSESIIVGVSNGDVLLLNCKFVNNKSRNISCYNSDAVFQNCIFEGNTGNYSCVVSHSGSANEVVISHCTFMNNEGYSIESNPGPLTVVNSILWDGEDGDSVSPIYVRGAGSVSVTYSCVQDGWTGAGNISCDPLLVDGWHLCHLPANSPCVDAGTSIPTGGLPTTDFEGNSRLVGSAPDMGVHEIDTTQTRLALYPEETIELAYLGDGTLFSASSTEVMIRNLGGGTLSWTLASSDSWLTLSQTSGQATTETEVITLGVNGLESLVPGEYTATITATASGAVDNPVIVPVKLTILGRIYVEADGSGDYPTIQTALDKASAYDVVILGDGVYTGTGNRDLCKKYVPLIVRSQNGPENCIIDVLADSNDPHFGFSFKYLFDSGTRVEGITVRNVYSGADGGCSAAISCSSGFMSIANCRFENNCCLAGGTLDVSNNSSVTVSDCSFTGNFGLWGSAFCMQDSTAMIQNCLIAGNTADAYGAILSTNSTFAITNSTIVDNESTQMAPGGVYFGGTETNIISNCIIRNNTLNGSPADQISLDSATVDVTYSNIEGGWTGTGNIDLNPQFMNASQGVYRLQSTSPCIDAGDNTSVPENVDTDLDGCLRFFDAPNTTDTGNGTAPIVDMGAYEYRETDVATVESVAYHGTTYGDQGIQIYPVQTVMGFPYNCESRYFTSGETHRLDIALGQAIPSDVDDITVIATDAFDFAQSATVSLNAAGDTITAVFDPLLPNNRIYTVDVSSAYITDMNFEYVIQQGNIVNFNGMNIVNGFDKSLLMGVLGSCLDNPDVDARFDIARVPVSIGCLDAFDKSLLIARMGQSAARLTSAVSMANHGATEGDLGIQVWPVPDGSTIGNCEPRILTEQTLALTFDGNVEGYAAPLTVEAEDTSSNVYTATVTTSGNTAEAVFNPALPDEKIYTVTVSGCATGTFEYVVLGGNVYNTGTSVNVVNTEDDSDLDTYIGDSPGTVGAQYDLDTDGVIGTQDETALTNRLSNTAS